MGWKFKVQVVMGKVAILIDDDFDDMDFLRESIQTVDPSTRCIGFNNPCEAIEKIASEDWPFLPDYIFIDFNMPRMNGEECLSELKQLKRLSSAIFILNSTGMSLHLAQKLKTKGADLTFQKPYKVEMYNHILKSILQVDRHDITVCESCTNQVFF